MLGKKIQQLRKDNGMSQEELALKLTISRQAISKWELGESMPDTDNVVQLSKLFGVSTDYLLIDDNGSKAIKNIDSQMSDLKSEENDENNKNGKSSLKKLFNFKNCTQKIIVWIIAAVFVIVAGIMILLLTRTNYVQVFFASPESSEVYALLSENSIRTRVKDGNIFVPENKAEEALNIIFESGFIPSAVSAHSLKLLEIQLANDLRELIIQMQKINDALVIINDRHVSVMLALSDDEKLPDSEIVSLYEVIRSIYPLSQEIKITDANLNIYSIDE